MKNEITSIHLFPELTTALIDGYHDNFILQGDGTLKCHSNPDRVYGIDDLNIIVVSCSRIKASLYLITTIDGVRGHMVDYWDNSSDDY